MVVTLAHFCFVLDLMDLVEKGNLADSDGSKDSSLESNEFRNYARNDSTFHKEVNLPIAIVKL